MKMIWKIRKIVIWVIIVVTVLSYSLTYLKDGLDNAVVAYAKADAVNIITKSINRAVADYINTKNLHYDDLCRIQKDGTGKIVSLTVNSSLLNIIKSEISISILEKIEELYLKEYSIPFGNILKSGMFSGRGFKIKIKIVPLGSMTSETKNTFTSTGINQSKHEIKLDLALSISVLAPFSSASVSITDSVLIAETLILGEVPLAYVTVNGSTTYTFTE